MNIIINNIEYNLIKKRLKDLEEAYKQSCDNNVLLAVKSNVYFDLIKINNFEQSFSKSFRNCKMANLKEIDELKNYIMNNIEVIKLPKIEINSIKNLLKLKEKDLNLVIKSFNQNIIQKNMTYYSQEINGKFIMLYYENNRYIGIVGNILKNVKMKDSLCAFCNTFRKSNEIIFVSNTVKSKTSEHNTIGLYCCKDYNMCNTNILNTDNLSTFMNYSGSKK